MANHKKNPEDSELKSRSGPWTDLGLTLPIFLGYHLGVIFLPVRNAADWVTRELVTLADQSMTAYGLLTLCIGGIYVSVLMMMGRGHALHAERFVFVGLEGIAYAVAMRLVAGYVTARIFLGPIDDGPFVGLVMALGAGFYEELAFRVGLYGVGAKLIELTFPGVPTLGRVAQRLVWAVVSAAVFSGWHYFGTYGDPFDLRSFTFRTVAGLVFTIIYAFRGFAPAVWTHALYDIWVLVF